MTAADSVYSALVNREHSDTSGLPEQVARDIPRNGLRLVAANTLQSSGDQAVNASTVLPWLFHVIGVPPALVGLLVPIRESGSMLPQLLLTPVVLRFTYRKWAFVLGALVQSGAVAAMAGIAAVGHGTAAGIAILAALVVFSLGRCLCSIASKDLQGRTVPPGERGQIIGLATSAAGIVAITLGLAVRVLGGDDLGAGGLALLLAAGALAWLLAAVVSARVTEPPGEKAAGDEAHDDEQAEPSFFARAAHLFREDPVFRRFVTVRGLVLVSSLSPPFIVTMSLASGTAALAGLGGFIVASGIASLIGGRLFGRIADRSSRLLMAWAAAAASLVVVAFVVVVTWPGVDGSTPAGTAFFVGGYFLLTLLHSGVRVGRKTYVVDVASGDLRTTYVAVSNSAMGVILLVVGAVSSAVATVGIEWALLLLAVLGLIGAASGARMPEVSQR